MKLGPCRVPGYPTDESSTRLHFAGSITRIGNFTLINFILINYDAINKADRKTYHWKPQNISFATRYALPTKLSRCNDHGPSPSASKSSSTLSGLATFVLICLFSGTRIPDRYGNRVPGSKNIRKRTGLDETQHNYNHRHVNDHGEQDDEEDEQLGG